MEQTIAIDFDNTICEINEGYYKNGGTELLPIGKLKKGAKNFLDILRLNKYKIIIHSCRFTPSIWGKEDAQKQAKKVEKFLKEKQVPFDELWVKEGKPLAGFYIDDRAIKFESWGQVYYHLENADPYLKELE